MRGTFHINSGRLDANTRISTREIKLMYKNGHEIAGHTVHHTNLGNVGTSARRKAICDDASNLNNIDSGINVTSFAYVKILYFTINLLTKSLILGIHMHQHFLMRRPC